MLSRYYVDRSFSESALHGRCMLRVHPDACLVLNAGMEMHVGIALWMLTKKVLVILRLR